MAKECMLSTGKLPLGGLPRNSVVRITGRPDMTTHDLSCCYRGRKATNQYPLCAQGRFHFGLV